MPEKEDFAGMEDGEREGRREPHGDQASLEEHYHDWNGAPAGRSDKWSLAMIVLVALVGLIIGLLLGANGW